MTTRRKVLSKREVSSSSEKSGGEWRPDYPAENAPLLCWPPRPVAVLEYFVKWGGFLFPWHTFYALVSILVYFYATPPLERFADLLSRPFWEGTLYVFVRNQILLWINNGFYYFILFQLRVQGMENKYIKKWPEDTINSRFTFGNQVYDNIFWCSVSGVGLWTAYEVFFLHLWAAGYSFFPFYFNLMDYPIYSFALMIFVPLWRHFHFYWVHRLIHWKPLYKICHHVHHRNVNTMPWSGLSMHPLEHVFYYSCVLLHLLIPSHPVHVLYNIQHAALTPAGGHTGYEGAVWNGRIPQGSYHHFLHHRYFECNYGTELIPLDLWFGTFRDGKDVGTHLQETEH